MKVSVLALAIGLSAVAVACGSSSGSGPSGGGIGYDFASVNEHFDHPDGTLNDKNLGQVLSSRDDASGVDVGSGANSGGTNTKSLRILGGQTAKCTAFANGQRSGSCACDNGGSFDYEISSAGGQGASVSDLKFDLHQCKFDEDTVDGSEYMHTESKGQESTLLFVIDVTETRSDGKTVRINAQERFQDNGFELAAKVDDGWVTIKYVYDANGFSLVIRDKNGTWTCSETDGKTTCSGSGGQTLAWSSGG